MQSAGSRQSTIVRIENMNMNLPHSNPETAVEIEYMLVGLCR